MARPAATRKGDPPLDPPMPYRPSRDGDHQREHGKIADTSEVCPHRSGHQQQPAHPGDRTQLGRRQRPGKSPPGDMSDDDRMAQSLGV